MQSEKSLELDQILGQVKQYCSFSLSQEAVDQTEVSYDPLIIRREHARMKEALAAVIHYGEMPFHGIRDISVMLESTRRGRVLTAQELVQEIHFIQGVRSIVSYEKELTDIEHPYLKDLCGTLHVHTNTEKFLSACVDDYGEILDTASGELRSIRMELKKADQAIASAAQKFLAAHPDSVVDSIVTYRGGRAVILVKASDKNAYGGMLYGDSASGQTSYIEPASLVGPNNRKQELIERERQEIERILEACSQEVQAVAAEEMANLQTCTVLDTVFAKAQWGKAHDGCAASLTEEKKIVIEKGRHPLIDPKKVVANSYQISDPKRILLITGPNTGGKTVSMKIIGLFTIMTYIGIPVTADSAMIPFFDRVFVDIGDDQSVAESLSSFSAHIRKQAEVMKEATENSLVLLDEVGSGTDPREGEALAISILNELRQRHCITVATTHYGRLKAYGKRHDDIQIASVAFDMKNLMPTYRFVQGISGSSNAFEVAQRYGLPAGLIKYARFLKDQAKTQEDELIERLDAQLNEAAAKTEELQKAIEQNRKKAEELKAAKIKFEKEKDLWQQNAEKEANAYLEEVRQQADAIMKELRQRKTDVKYHEAIDLSHQLNALSTEPKTQDDNVPAGEIEYEVGDAVELRGSSQVCEVLEVGRKDLKILMNGREIRVKKDKVRPSLHIIPKMKEKPQTTVHISSGGMFSSMPLECNLIGMRVDEAMDVMADYMDRAKVHHLKTFRIIHGDGTGRLRNAVHAKLRTDKSVKEFRLGVPGEGGTGATVVVMK